MLVSLSNQRFDFIFLNILKAQTSILPSFPKTLISRCCVECMKLSYLSQPCIPCQLPLLSHGEQQRIMESHLNGSSMIFIIMWRILHGGDINPFHDNYHAITFLFGNEVYIASSLLFLSAMWGSFSTSLITLKNCASVKSNRAATCNINKIFRIRNRIVNPKLYYLWLFKIIWIIRVYQCSDLTRSQFE